MKRALLYIAGPLLVAALAPIPIGIFYEWFYVTFMIGGLPIVLFYALFVAAPLFAFLVRRRSANIWTVTALAFSVGFGCYFLHSLMTSFFYEVKWNGPPPGPDIYIYAGHRTALGWRYLLSQSLTMGLLTIPGGWLWLAAFTTRADAPAAGAKA